MRLRSGGGVAGVCRPGSSLRVGPSWPSWAEEALLQRFLGLSGSAPKFNPAPALHKYPPLHRNYKVCTKIAWCLMYLMRGSGCTSILGWRDSSHRFPSAYLAWRLLCWG
jgi:hypothetical protein